MYTELSLEDLVNIDGGVNALKVAGGILLVLAGLGGCATGGFSWAGAAGVAGGAGCIIDGLKE